MSKYINKLQDKRIIIFGGTSGIGFAVAESAIEHGAIVTIASSKQAKIDHALQRLKQSYPTAKVSGRTADLSSANVEDEITAVFQDASNTGKDKIDHVVYTAGDALKPALLAKITPDDILLSFRVRLVGPMIGAKVALKFLNSSVASSYTITSGVGDDMPTPGRGTLAPVSGAVKALGRALAVEMAPIRANVVCPGPVRTEMYNIVPEADRENALNTMKERTLTGTLGKPEDLAETYLSIMRNTFVTGSSHYSDGGYLLKKML